MFGFDVFPVAAASLDLTADLAPLFWGLSSILSVSAIAITVTAVAAWLRNTRQAVSVPVTITSANLEPREQAKAA